MKMFSLILFHIKAVCRKHQAIMKEIFPLGAISIITRNKPIIGILIAQILMNAVIIFISVNSNGFLKILCKTSRNLS